MAVNDITQVNSATFGANSDVKYNVAANATAILVGEPVARALAGVTVTQAATNSPVASSIYWVGIAKSASTQTASVAGTVQVQPFLPGQIWSVKPKVAASWDTQAEYDALVGKRVLMDLTTSSFTILAADSANNGLIVMPLTISEDPGRVHFSVRATAIDMGV